jgi:FtsP/CotA-like multicopper oxidase with cupredoxin domain
MKDFNLLTFNSKAFPGTEPLLVRTGDRVRLRFGNLSAMDHHPIHLHGFAFELTATDGGYGACTQRALSRDHGAGPVGLPAWWSSSPSTWATGRCTAT